MATVFPSNGSIHGIPTYMNYVQVIDYSAMQAFIPFLYIIPTFIIMIFIFFKHQKAKMMMNTSSMDPNIFTMIMLYFFFNAIFFVGDYIRLNLPTSGLVTSACAHTEPSWIYTFFIMFAYAGDYGTISCPLLTTLVRFTMILSPHNHTKYCRMLMRRFVFPFIILMPVTLTLINIPAIGYCRQLDFPFHFGAILLSEGENFQRNNFLIHVSFSYITFTSHIVLSVYMFTKIRTTNSSSVRTRELSKKAELSLTLTMASCIVPFITNSIVSFTFLFDRPNWAHFIFLRVLGNDYETTMLPWILFFTHPLFRRKKAPKLSPALGSTIWQSNTNTPRSSSQMF